MRPQITTASSPSVARIDVLESANRRCRGPPESSRPARCGGEETRGIGRSLSSLPVLCQLSIESENVEIGCPEAFEPIAIWRFRAECLAWKRSFRTDRAASEVIHAARIRAAFERRAEARCTGAQLTKDTAIAVAIVGVTAAVARALGPAAAGPTRGANAIAGDVLDAVRGLGMMRNKPCTRCQSALRHTIGPLH